MPAWVAKSHRHVLAAALFPLYCLQILAHLGAMGTYSTLLNCFNHCGSDGKEYACNAGVLDSVPGLGRSSGEGEGSPLQYSGLEHSMDCTVCGVAESDTTERLSLHPPILLPDSSVGKESACSAGDPGSIPGLRKSAGDGTGYPLQYSWGSLMAQLIKNLPTMGETWDQSLGWEDPLETEKATHSSILAWTVLWTV